MAKHLTIGIACYPSVGGSGIVATQLGLELARRGHQVHFISYERPFQLPARAQRMTFHRVPISAYQLFRYPDYTLPLAVTMADVHIRHHLDIMHVHYAVPHATAALLARHMLLQRKEKAFRVITTLHGTDITIVGRDPSLMPITKYSIEQSCGVTAVSRSLARETKSTFGIRRPIEVVYNFYTPLPVTVPAATIRRRIGVRPHQFLVSHASNLRPVKRVPDILKTMARVRRQHDVKLLVLAGGSFNEYRPLVTKLKLTRHVIVKSNVLDVHNYLSASDAGLYTSDHESFGMSILETMSYARPVLATRAGGVPEVVEHGRSGLLYRVGDIAGMAHGLGQLITDASLRARLARGAAERAATKFSTPALVDRYVSYYRRIVKQE